MCFGSEGFVMSIGAQIWLRLNLGANHRVAALGDGPDEFLRIVLQGVPKSAHGLRQRVVGHRDAVPNGGEYLVAADDAIGVARKEG